MNNTTISNNFYSVATGTASSNPFVDIFLPRDPNGNDVYYPVQKKWLNTTNNNYWILVGFISSGGVISANWTKIESSTVATNYVTNSGTAEPLAGVLNILGTQGINTTGSGDTVKVIGQPSVAAGSSSLSNLGVASFNNAQFTVDSNGYVSASGEIATTYTEDTGTATPASGNLNINGTSSQGIVTSGSGSTVTITADNASSTQKGVASFNSAEFTVTAGAVASNAITVDTTGIVTVSGSPVNLGGTVTIGTTIPAYVTGSWTPVLSFGGSSTGITYAFHSGEYTQIGNVLFFDFGFTLTSVGSATGSALISGLPNAAFTASHACLSYNQNLSYTGYNTVSIETIPSTTTIQLILCASNSALSVATNGNFTNNTTISGSGFYFTS